MTTDIEQPKVLGQEEVNKPNELMILATNVFNRDEEGKKLFATMRALWVSDKYHATVLPATPALIAQYGSVEAYMSFREGQKSVVFYLEHMMDQYKQLEANQPKE